MRDIICVEHRIALFSVTEWPSRSFTLYDLFSCNFCSCAAARKVPQKAGQQLNTAADTRSVFDSEISCFCKKNSIIGLSSWLACFSAPDREAEYCDNHVCLYICLSVNLSAREHISGNTFWSLPIFSACCPWPWLHYPLAASRYVMYFRFYGWRHTCA